MTGRSGGSAAFVAPDAYFFDGHRFEPATGTLVLDGGRARTARLAGGELHLRPKTAAVLTALLERAGGLVTKAELIDEVWDGATGDESIAVCVAELRRLLGERADDPHYVATVHRRGYRFGAPVTTAPRREGRGGPGPVGREPELGELAAWRSAATAGDRVVGFVAGEAGAGKTTLVREFVARLLPERQVLGEGRCATPSSEASGPALPFQPFLDAISAICRGPGGASFREILWRTAPTWLLQLPELIEPAAVERLRRRAVDRSIGRMMREAAAAFDAMSAVAPVVIVIEDLHAGDDATVELVAHLADRASRARLLLIATYRGEEVPGGGELADVVGRLVALRRAEHLELGPLDASAVASLLARSERRRPPGPEVVAAVLDRSEGNAMFVSALVARLVETDGVDASGGSPMTTAQLATAEVPVAVERLIADRLDRLPAGDRRVLLAAAAVGVECSVTEAAAALAVLADGDGADDDGVDAAGVAGETDVGRALARTAANTGVIVETEPIVWPDGSVDACYRFAHRLAREVLDARLGAAARIAVHRAIAERLTARATPGSLAGTAAEHYELGRQPDRAAEQYARAAEAAHRALDTRRAREYAGRGIRLAAGAGAGVPAAVRLRLHLQLIAALLGEHGPSAEDLGDSLAEVEVLCGSADDPMLVARARHVLWSLAFMRGDLVAAGALFVDFEVAVADVDDAVLATQLADARALTLLAEGSPALALAAVSRPEAAGAGFPGGSDRPEAVVVDRSTAALASWLVGRADDARALALDGLRVARESGAPGIVCRSLWPVIAVHQLRGERARVRQYAAQLAAVAELDEHSRWRSVAALFDGWARPPGPGARSGARETAHPAEHLMAGGMGFGRPYHLAVAAETAALAGDHERADATIDEALSAVASTGDRWYHAELLRARAEILVASARGHPERGVVAEIDELLEEAVAVARAQGASAIEVRALTGLVRRGDRTTDGAVHAGERLAQLLDELGEGIARADRVAAVSALRASGAARHVGSPALRN